jgi:hypothetical protein
MSTYGDAVSVRAYTRFATITPSNTTQYGPLAQAAGVAAPTEAIDAIYVVATGQITIAGSDLISVSFGATVPVGTIIPCSPRQVLAATAATVVALYR